VVMRLTLRVILKPLNEASAIAARISPRNQGARIHVEKLPDELRPLVENFNGALDRLEHNYRLQRDFLASAAHELKTPLALIRAQIEMGVDETNRNELMRDVSRMGRQVQQLLHLAEASEPLSYSFASVDLESLVHEAASYMERLADQQGVSLRVIVDLRICWRMQFNIPAPVASCRSAQIRLTFPWRTMVQEYRLKICHIYSRASGGVMVARTSALDWALRSARK
jgi:signal transduction histidine kinase